MKSDWNIGAFFYLFIEFSHIIRKNPAKRIYHTEKVYNTIQLVKFLYESIIFIAARTNINPELYEAAEIDGAGRMKRLCHVTLPGILSTLVVIYIMRIGNIMNVGWQTIYLMQNELNLETSEVISTFVYKRGLIDSDYGYSTAVGLFNNLIGFILVLIANKLSKVFTESSLF